MNTTTTSTTEFLDLPDGRLAYDDTGDRTLALRHEFQPTGVYLDSATYGLPPKVALQALSAVTGAWASGRYDPVSCDQAVGRARSTFARLHSVLAEDVAIGHQVSPIVGLIAASLPSRARVLAAEGDFTSLLFPLLAAGCDVRTIPLERLADAIDSRTDLVAVSAVQSADGRLADLDAISNAAASHDALTLVDATQACGWLPIDARRFSIVVTGGYKWLCHPRGTAFMTIAPEPARPDRPASRRLVRRRASLGHLLRNPPATRQRRPPLRRLARLAELARRRRHAGTVRSRRARTDPRTQPGAGQPAPNRPRTRAGRIGDRFARRP